MPTSNIKVPTPKEMELLIVARDGLGSFPEVVQLLRDAIEGVSPEKPTGTLSLSTRASLKPKYVPLSECLYSIGFGGISAVSFNRLLIEKGFLENYLSPVSLDGSYKRIINEGLSYGKNFPEGSLVTFTSPLWNDLRFPDLYALVMEGQ